MSRELAKMNMIGAVQKLQKSDIECVQCYVEMIEKENQQLKELKHKFIDNSGDDDSFTLKEYLDISNKLYETEQQLKQRDEVINEAIKYLVNNYLINTKDLKIILKKAKGDSNE